MSIRGLTGPPFAPAWAFGGIPLLAALAAPLALRWLWTDWNQCHIFLSYDLLPAMPIPPECLEAAWATLTLQERCFLVQGATEGVANPKQSHTYLSLTAKRWLGLSPAVRPVRPAVCACLIAGISLAVLFLFLTQPALPLDFLGLPSFVAAAIGSLVKWSDQLSSLLSPVKKNGA